MDPRWQPNLGPVQPACVLPEACDLLAAGWHAQQAECWIAGAEGTRMVSLETWRALRDRAGFVPARVRMQV
jgi:hypothetical protein